MLSNNKSGFFSGLLIIFCSPTITSGIRLGSPAATTRGFKEKEFEFIGESISTVINTLSSSNSDIEMLEKSIKKEVYDLCQRFPIYKN